MSRNISTLLTAIKKNDRTDLYVVLAALYSLNADKVPATVKKIKAALKLHLGNQLPSNINASLRKSPSCVEPIAEGPPILWRLTSEGVAKLRTLSGLALSEPPSEASFDYDIAIICALEEPEFNAVAQALGGASAWKEVGDARYAHVYRETTLVTDDGKTLRIVGTASTSMGLTAAAIATTQLTLQFKPRMVAMIGIAAGTRSGDKQFGDVLTADPSVDYNSGKVVEANGIREFLPDPYPIGLNARLRSVLKKYGTRSDVFQKIRSRWSGPVPQNPNRLHLGPLGAADQVIEDPTKIIEITKNWRKLVGVEMETYAVYRACHESPDPKPRFVSFKAVCDFAAEKTDSWQSYAAFMAAQFAVDFFKAEWTSLWPNDRKEN